MNNFDDMKMTADFNENQTKIYYKWTNVRSNRVDLKPDKGEQTKGSTNGSKSSAVTQIEIKNGQNTTKDPYIEILL